MNSDIKPYKDALKFAFSQVYGGQAADWTDGDLTTNEAGKILCEFKNAKAGILLSVTELEPREEGKFNAKRLDVPNNEMNVSCPPSWKN